MGSNHSIVLEIKRAADTSHKNLIREGKLSEIVFRHLPSLKSDWPSHGDALKAFQVFDSEGVGFIKVTMLKRFLVQAQLDVEESVCKYWIKYKPPLSPSPSLFVFSAVLINAQFYFFTVVVIILCSYVVIIS